MPEIKTSPTQGLSFVVGFALIVYVSISVWQSLLGAMQHYVLYTTAILIYLALRLYSKAAERKTASGAVTDKIVAGFVFLGSSASGFYLMVNAESLEITQPFVSNMALGMGLVLIAAVLLAVWRVWGLAIALICLAMTGYMIFGKLLPDVLQGRMQPFNVSVSFLAGIGGPRGVMSYASLSVDMIFMLLIYGGVLHATGIIHGFGEIGTLIGNRLRGGVAYGAVLASTLIGMVTGQAVSNIALSGVMTIPAMKKNGFSSENAAAVEIMASTGSQLLPPIMGLGAFMMAVILGVSYFDIVVAALIPGVLYMFAIVVSIFAMIGVALGPDRFWQSVDIKRLMWIAPAFLFSFAVLITLLMMRYSPAMAGFWGAAVAAGLSMIRPAELRPSLTSAAAGLRTGLDTAAHLSLILAAIGLVVQSLTTTGLGVSAGALISDLGGDSLHFVLVIGMVVSLIVGMGLPTPAAYALIAIIVVPSLIDAGVTPIAANMFGFYFAIFSALTPPVAVGVLVGARIAGAGFLATALAAGKIGAMALLLPFLFVRFPTMLNPLDIDLHSAIAIGCFLTASVLGSGAIYGGLGRPLKTPIRVIFAFGGPIALLAYAATGILIFGLLPIAMVACWVGFAWRQSDHAAA